MKILAVILLIIPLLAQSQTVIDSPSTRNNFVDCGPAQEIFGILLEQYKEAPEWYGTSEGSPLLYSIWTNKKTGSWSLIIFNKDEDKNSVCVLSVGTHFIFSNEIKL